MAKKTKAPVESLVGKKYQRTGKDTIVTVVSHDIERCSVIIEFADGKTTTLTTTTLKDRRKWVEVLLEPVTTPVEESVTTPVEENMLQYVSNILTELHIQHKLTGKYVLVKDSLQIYKLRGKIRLFTTNAILHKCNDTDLLTDVTTTDSNNKPYPGKLNVSVYITSTNIKQVLKYLLDLA